MEKIDVVGFVRRLDWENTENERMGRMTGPAMVLEDNVRTAVLRRRNLFGSH
jgi:hypothetical protein